MYEAFFGLSGPPFQLNPDPAFYFNSRGHGHALAYLRYGVAQGEGFIVVTGEIGAGKTTLVRTLLGELDRQQVVAAQIVSTQLDSGDLLQSIITAFGIPAQGASKAYMIATLEAFLTTLAAQGRRALLIVDEAQNLNPGAVEELRMLSNFQLGNHSLLQSFLIGQPELRRILELPTMEQLRQRVSASCHLGPLDAEETRAYIAHRLQRVGWNGRPPISDAAYAELYRWSGGVPRRINRLANRVLLATFLEGRAEVDATLVEATARELRGEIGEVGAEPAPVATLAPLAQPPAAAGGAPAALASPVSSTVPPSAFAPALEEAGPAALADDEALDAAAAQAGTELSASDTADALADADLDAETTALLSDPDLLLALAVADEITAESPDEAADQAWAADGNEAPSPAVVDDAPRWAGMLPSAAARRCDLLVLVDGAADALAAAALLQALTGTDATAAEAPEVVLVSVGPASEVWPWEEFERLLRRPASLHLGLDTAAGFEALLAPLVERLGPALDELQPRAALVLGAGDAVLAAALLLHKRGLPLCQLAGHALLTGPAESANEAVLAALSQVTPSQSAHPTV
ncbi:MAG: hypothetical protein RL722_450, partial [Pseudomonadota bacterium]